MVRHIGDRHIDHPDPLFPQCAHDEVGERDWVYIGKIVNFIFNSIPFQQ